MKALIITLIFSISVPVFGACEKNVQKVTTGTPSPCDAWIVSPEQMQKFDKAMDKVPVDEKINKVNEELVRISTAEMEYYKQKSKSQSVELEKAETRHWFATAGAFTLGVVLTGIAAKAAIEASRK